MRWSFAFKRAARTFFQTFGGSLAAVQFVFDAALAKDVAQAATAAAFAAVVAFCMNVSGE